ncbi:FKBP-type peptidyl-prolyl cis-trans isomerase [Plebeiibacterium marinum]|uniref:Peptidyl-prolyl cis-trans isomerase n=1 Tax=Plebeiibacterium marinum TaxID=2992111 RepID=A0AAE3MBR9_9BACT|nr:FKBP-type peptidyl-prolyl cis-trans isomerase [Plebeiobacterium marinum]MCW3804694.1 FKBP-type peptidyl-prolyl cis-trans isomerase [Plebeiobacterium marinum]
MEISRNKMVTLSYVLRLNGFEGEIVEETSEEKPLEFIFGTGRMLQMFENKLEGLKAGEEFKFELKADDAYGQINEEAKVNIPKNIFEVNDGKMDEELIKVGNMVPMQDAQGNRLNGIVLDVTDEHVQMDFNHPLAGDDLFFSGAVKEVREATDEEIMAVVGGGGCGSGCGCGDAQTGCDSGSCGSDGSGSGGCGCS